MKKHLLLFSFLLFMGLTQVGWGQTTGDYRTVQAAVAWATANNWQTWDGTQWATAGSAPSSTNDVYIQSGHVATLGADASCKNLFISCGTTNATTGSEGIVALGANVLSINGKLSLYFGAIDVTVNSTAALPLTASATGNSAPITKTANSNTGRIKFVGDSRTITPTGEWGAFNTGSTTTFDVEIALNSGQTATCVTSIKAYNWYITSGTLDAGSTRVSADNGTTGSGNVTISSGATIISAQTGTSSQVISRGGSTRMGTFTINSGGTLQVTGATPTINASSVVLSGTVIYSKAGAQTLLQKGNDASAVTFPTYTNLTISGSGIKTTALATTVSGTATVNTGCTLATATTFTANGSVAINGSFQINEGGSATGTSFTYGASSTLNYSGTSAQVSTDVEFPSSNGPASLTLNNSTGVTIHAARTLTGTLTLGGNNSYVNLNTVTGQASLIYSATVPQTTGSELGVSITDLTIYNSNGVTLGGSTTVNGTLSFYSGNLILGTNDLTLGGSVSSPAAGNCVVTNSTGVVKMILPGAIIQFPIGPSITMYNPVNITNNTGTPYEYTARVEIGENPATADDLKSANRTWILTGTATGGSGVNLSLSWRTTEAGANIVPASAVAWRYDGSAWTEVGGTTSAGTPNTTEVTGTTSLSSWTVGNPGALPVELTSFSALVQNKTVNLAWQTATEVNNNGFAVERTIQNSKLKTQNWEKIGFVAGNGNSNSTKNYSYTDNNVTSGKYIYRLKQIDNDGKYTYSKEVEVDLGMPTAFVLEQNYPNPFNPTTKIRFELPEESNVTLRVFNILGEEVATLVNKVITPGRQEVTFDGSNLSSGMYIYRIEAGNFVEVKKLLLMK